MRIALSLLLGTVIAGCAGTPRTGSVPSTIRIDPASLASAPAIHPDAQWRVRIPIGTTPPADHICHLCDQYAVIEIRSPETWRAFCNQTGLNCPEGAPDFDDGIIVGLVAGVGEPADGAWPTAISEVRLQDDGAAWLRSQFRTGLYRPLLVDAYCNLIYTKGLKKVILVEINRRAYLTAH
ncbi:MAG: hypothetical protein JXQ73_16655 [Phycisphaerae bacterium]|nr:hypothetical protein [Phycisphaerae bacterium]